jgi:hypothetical protein
MSQSTVERILDLIEHLSETDREVLQRRLAERAEAQWRREAERPRKEAKARGIDQKAIDEAVRKLRYGT